jgi:hypothetical protein
MPVKSKYFYLMPGGSAAWATVIIDVAHGVYLPPAGGRGNKRKELLANAIGPPLQPLVLSEKTFEALAKCSRRL